MPHNYRVCLNTVYRINLKLVVHGDLSVINKNTIIMSNHYEGLDFVALMSLFVNSNKNISNQVSV